MIPKVKCFGSKDKVGFSLPPNKEDASKILYSWLQITNMLVRLGMN